MLLFGLQQHFCLFILNAGTYWLCGWDTQIPWGRDLPGRSHSDTGKWAAREDKIIIAQYPGRIRKTRWFGSITWKPWIYTQSTYILTVQGKPFRRTALKCQLGSMRNVRRTCDMFSSPLLAVLKTYVGSFIHIQAEKWLQHWLVLWLDNRAEWSKSRQDHLTQDYYLRPRTVHAPRLTLACFFLWIQRKRMLTRWKQHYVCHNQEVPFQK